MLGLEFSDKHHPGQENHVQPGSIQPPAAWGEHGPQETKAMMMMMMIQEPVNRMEPVEKVQAPETARTMRHLFESGVPGLHQVARTVPDIQHDLQIPGSGIFENTPTRLEGVMRCDEPLPQEADEAEVLLLSGTTKSRLDDYLEKSKLQFVPDRKPVRVAEDEGKVLENTPIQRDDVIRERDVTEAEEEGQPREGLATTLRQHWINLRDEFVKDDRPVQLVERQEERAVYENQPEVRQDVLREEDPTDEGGLRMGLASDMKNYWVNYRDREIYARDKPIDLPGPEAPAGILENEPIRLEGVVREEDPTADEIAAIEKGKARSLVNRWQSIDEGFQGREAFDLQRELAAGREAGIFENVPDVLREGVVKCGEAVDEVVTKEGVARQMSELFRDSDFWNPRSDRAAPVMELAEGPGVHENVPSQLAPDVVRCDADADESLYEMRRMRSGVTSQLVGRWVRNDLDGADLVMPDKSYFHDPRKLLEKERAEDAGVYENKPTVRRDVYREDDDQLEMIPAQKTKKLKQLWMTMGQDAPKKTGVPQQIRFTPPREMTPPEGNGPTTTTSTTSLIMSGINGVDSSSNQQN